MAKKKKKYYAVAKGAVPGIYEEWAGPAGAEMQVKAYPGARYKSFSAMEDAVSWMKEALGGSFSAPEAGNKPGPEKKTRVPVGSASVEKGRIVIYTDGGALGNPGPGGYGAVLSFGEHRKELSGGFRNTTNNRMELLACIMGLSALKKPSPVVLYSDSKYVVDGISKGWAKRWKARGWMRNAKDAAENTDMWARLLDLCDVHDVIFQWVKGHAGIPGNERCDELANGSARGENLPPDENFESGKTKLAENLF